MPSKRNAPSAVTYFAARAMSAPPTYHAPASELTPLILYGLNLVAGRHGVQLHGYSFQQHGYELAFTDDRRTPHAFLHDLHITLADALACAREHHYPDRDKAPVWSPHDATHIEPLPTAKSQVRALARIHACGRSEAR